MIVNVDKVRGTETVSVDDTLALEEPLEIRIGEKSVSITMRTPGDDPELSAGFLFTEGILKSASAIKSMKVCPNIIRLELVDETGVDLKRLERHFYATSSCGVCGKSSLDALTVKGLEKIAGDFAIEASLIHQLPETLRASQAVFDRTGGLHAAALFDKSGKLVCLREDVGRHNAVDKVIGRAFLDDKTPLSKSLLFVSGRASFELMQKALVAGIPMLAAVGAPSSLAVELAKRFDVSLLGFVRDKRFNLYHGGWRVRGL